MELFNYRKSYTKDKLSINDIGGNPIDFFVKWFKEAENSDQIIEPNAMTISTVDENSFPSSRVVLLKQIKERSLIFFTNYNSNKAVSIDQNNKVSISFFWEDFERRVLHLVEAGYPGCIGCGGPGKDDEWDEEENRIEFRKGRN